MLLAACLLTACSSDVIEDGSTQRTPLEIMPLSTPSFLEINSATRTDYLPDGYIWYKDLVGATNPAYANIGMFMTPDRTTPTADYIYLNSSDNTWSSTISVESGQTYYMYGFMPRQGAQSATISSLNSNYANGAVIHLNNFQTLTPADVCVVVGVRKATDTEAGEGVRAPQSDVDLGKFEFKAAEEGHNSAFILMKHIYSGLRFRAVIDHDYHQLRDIKFTKVELIAKDMEPTVDIDVTLTANTEGTDPMTDVIYSEWADPVDENTIELFPWTGSATEYQLKETETNMFLGCFTPGKCSEFVIRTTYNVYDKSKNKIREGCVAENKINESIVPGLAEIEAGEVYTITCTVKPTYLYVLSDPDLDNPTFTITATP